MPPLTLAILASVLQMHGADATITSDNKGVEHLLSAVRGQLEQEESSVPTVALARMVAPSGGATTYAKGFYNKGSSYSRYNRWYGRFR
jgi:hypothetical protein